MPILLFLIKKRVIQIDCESVDRMDFLLFTSLFASRPTKTHTKESVKVNAMMTGKDICCAVKISLPCGLFFEGSV